ncbi:MAG: response regulator [Kiritimatiellae bacterium]|nr:response regulator [Kiritimatiellia bacterium]
MKNILIIDDDVLICRLIEKLVQQKDVLITIVNNGKVARDVLQSGKKFDVVFLDLILPHISGWDILTVINNYPATQDTPVVIMTGFSLSDKETERLQGKVFAIINKKTFNKEELVEILEKLLQI